MNRRPMAYEAIELPGCSTSHQCQDVGGGGLLANILGRRKWPLHHFQFKYYHIKTVKTVKLKVF